MIAKETSWLEDIKESKQNTGLNSLKQASRINQKGIYMIGIPDTKINHKPNDLVILNLMKF